MGDHQTKKKQEQQQAHMKEEYGNEWQKPVATEAKPKNTVSAGETDNDKKAATGADNDEKAAEVESKTEDKANPADPAAAPVVKKDSEKAGDDPKPVPATASPATDSKKCTKCGPVKKEDINSTCPEGGLHALEPAAGGRRRLPSEYASTRPSARVLTRRSLVNRPKSHCTVL